MVFEPFLNSPSFLLHPPSFFPPFFFFPSIRSHSIFPCRNDQHVDCIQSCFLSFFPLFRIEMGGEKTLSIFYLSQFFSLFLLWSSVPPDSLFSFDFVSMRSPIKKGGTDSISSSPVYHIRQLLDNHGQRRRRWRWM